MTTRKRNIYSIGPGAGAACLVFFMAWLGIVPGQAAAQCEGGSGATDEYCETIPGTGGDRGVAVPRAPLRGGGVPARTGRALERAEANALRRVESPRKHRRRATKKPVAAAPAPNIHAEDGGSALPYILAALAAALLLAALVRRLNRASGSPDEPAV